MDNQQIPKKESEVHDSASPAKSETIKSQEIQRAENPTPTPTCRRQTSHTSLDIADDGLAASSKSAEQRECLIFKVSCKVLCKVVFKFPLTVICLCVVAMIVAVVVGLSITWSLITATVALPLLLVSFFVIRLLQFFSHGDAYDKAVQLKLYIRVSMLGAMVMFLIILWIFFLISKRAPGLKNVLLLGLSLADWVSLYYVIFGIYILSCSVSVVTINLLPLVPLDHTDSGLKLPETVVEIIDCLIFWWAESEVMKRVITFKHHKILGLNTQKWIEASIFVLVAYNVITLSTYMIVWLLRKLVCHKILKPGTKPKSPKNLIIEKLLRGKYLMYWANGMKRSINFILRSLMLLVTWVSYFGSNLDKTPQAKYILDFGTWTCLSLLICSFLWLVKTCVLRSWEACSVYDRLNSKILEGGKQLYFLGIIGCCQSCHKYDILNLLYDSKEDETIWIYDIDDQRFRQFVSNLCKTLFPTWVIFVNKREDKQVNEMKLLGKKQRRVKHELLIQDGRTPTLYCIQQAAGYFLTAKQTLLEEKYTCDILENLKSHSEDDDHGSIEEKLKKLIQVGNDENDKTENSSENAPVKKDDHGSTEENLKQLIQDGNDESDETKKSSKNPQVKKDDWGYFEDQLHEYVGPSQEISPEIVRIWMEKARNNCLFLANTLSSAKEFVDCLNKIISWLLIVATFIMWLLLTGLASTEVLVIIASPLLAATFIFGDACKTLFQGIIFAYVMHPFDVGDLCVIDGNMVEVKTIGVWKSTFSKVGMQEKVLYPNSELSNKNIINYKTEFDWNDYLELDIVSLDKEKIKKLKQEIENYLEDSENGKLFTPGYNCVEVLPTEENMKIAINFRHNVNLKNSTYFECLKKKRKQRSEVVLHAQSLVNDMKYGKTKTSG